MAQVYLMTHATESGDLDFPALNICDESATKPWMKALLSHDANALKVLAGTQKFKWRTDRIPFSGKGPDWVLLQTCGACCSADFWERIKIHAPEAEWIRLTTDKDAVGLSWGVISGLPSANVLDKEKSNGRLLLHTAVLETDAQCPSGLFTPNEAFDVFFSGNPRGLEAAGLSLKKVP